MILNMDKIQFENRAEIGAIMKNIKNTHLIGNMENLKKHITI